VFAAFIVIIALMMEAASTSECQLIPDYMAQRAVRVSNPKNRQKSAVARRRAKCLVIDDARDNVLPGQGYRTSNGALRK
jgi:hypothetical protein